MTVENCFGTINMCLFWISLTMVTLSADCYCGTLCLWQPFYAEGIVHPTGQLFMAVHLIGYGSVPVLHSLSYLSLNSLNPWEAPGWQVIAIDADVKQVITSYLQTLDNSVFTLEYKPWYHSGANAEMVAVSTLRSDVYHLLHMCHVLFEVTITYWWVFVTLFFESSLYIHCSLSRWVHKCWIF